jgi:alpha-beta hydrolase superfamily lysophospholipase
MAWVKFALIALVVVPLVFTLVIGGLIAFGKRPPPPPMESITAPFAGLDTGDLPPLQTLRARDGTALAYRHWPGNSGHVVLALHGSSAESGSLHVLARALQEAGIGVYAPDIRGHGESGRRGDVDYIGQLEDDIADFTTFIATAHPAARITLLGFSSGGGLALRYTGHRDAAEIDRLVMLAPMLGIESPPVTAANPHAGDTEWARPFVPRIVGLSILNALGIHALDHLPVLAFAVEPDNPGATATWSYRLMVSCNPRDYAALLKDTQAPVTLLAGARDQVFAAQAYAPALHAVRPDATARLIEGVDHVGMTLSPQALDAVVAAVRASRD